MPVDSIAEVARQQAKLKPIKKAYDDAKRAFDKAKAKVPKKPKWVRDAGWATLNTAQGATLKTTEAAYSAASKTLKRQRLSSRLIKKRQTNTASTRIQKLLPPRQRSTFTKLPWSRLREHWMPPSLSPMEA